MEATGCKRLRTRANTHEHARARPADSYPAGHGFDAKRRPEESGTLPRQKRGLRVMSEGRPSLGPGRRGHWSS